MSKGAPGVSLSAGSSSSGLFRTSWKCSTQHAACLYSVVMLLPFLSFKGEAALFGTKLFCDLIHGAKRQCLALGHLSSGYIDDSSLLG